MRLGMGERNARRQNERGEGFEIRACEILDREARLGGLSAPSLLVVPDDDIGAALKQSARGRKAA